MFAPPMTIATPPLRPTARAPTTRARREPQSQLGGSAQRRTRSAGDDVRARRRGAGRPGAAAARVAVARVAMARVAIAACAFAAAPAAALEPTPAPAGANVTAVPAPRGLEEQLVDDARDGKLDGMGLLEAALVASGVADADVPAEAARVRHALAPAVARARTQRTAHKRGDVLLRALHDTVLRTYVVTATEIDDVVRTGEFNCLSSALLYVVAAQGLLDAPRGMVTRHHAFARVTVDGRAVDVETTIAGGFDTDRKKLMTPAYVKKIAGTSVSPAELLEDLEHPEELPALSLVAAVYSNRSVGLMHRGDLQGAAVALDRAHRLAAGSLRARTAGYRAGILNQGAVALVEQGRLDDARALLELAVEGTSGAVKQLLTDNLASVELGLARRALDGEDWTGALAHAAAAAALGARDADTAPVQARADSALAALEGSDARCKNAKPARVAATCYAGLARALDQRSAGSASDVDKALQFARRAYALDAGAENAEAALFNALTKKVHAEAVASRCDVVEALVREAALHAAALRGQPWSAGAVAANCWAHAGDGAFDKQAWAEAGRLYGRALAHTPDDAALRRNLARVDVNAAIGFAKDGACDAARARARRAAHADPSLAGKATELLESCAAVRANRAVARKDWATAAAELRRGLEDAPGSDALNRGLGPVLHNLAGQLLDDHDCDAARALVPDLDRFHQDDAKAAVVRQCR